MPQGRELKMSEHSQETNTARSRSTSAVGQAESTHHGEETVLPIVQGHVFKRSSHGIGSKIGFVSFKKRYFVLYEGALYYYQHQSNFEKDRLHGMKHGKKIVLDDLYLTHPTIHTASHCFMLHAPHKDNKRKSYLLAMTDRRSRNIWIDMLQQQNPQLQPSISETDGHCKTLPPYINMIRTLDNPSPIMHKKSLTPESIHISQLENYHYLTHRRSTWHHSVHSRPSSSLSKTSESSERGSLNSLSAECNSPTDSEGSNSPHEPVSSA